MSASSFGDWLNMGSKGNRESKLFRGPWPRPQVTSSTEMKSAEGSEFRWVQACAGGEACGVLMERCETWKGGQTERSKLRNHGILWMRPSRIAWRWNTNSQGTGKGTRSHKADWKRQAEGTRTDSNSERKAKEWECSKEMVSVYKGTEQPNEL